MNPFYEHLAEAERRQREMVREHAAVGIVLTFAAAVLILVMCFVRI